ncbi:hypothetical protein Tco_0076991 [Tanacetum coccineum]
MLSLSLTHHLDLHLLLIFLILFQRFLVGIMEVTDQAKEIKHLKAKLKKLKKQAKPVITHHRAWMKSVSLKQRTREVVDEEKEGTEDAVSTEGVVSTDKEKVSTDKEKVSSDRSKDSTAKDEEGTDLGKDSTVSLDEGTDDRTSARSATPITSTTTPTMFGDDETIAQVLLNMSQAKAVST